MRRPLPHIHSSVAGSAALCSDLALALHLASAVTRHIISAAILAVLLPLVGACAQDVGEEEDVITVEWPTDDKQRIWVEGNSEVDGPDLPGSAQAGACTCTTAECFDEWVADTFGCDVCATFVCDGQEVAHSCAPCDPTPLNQGETWDGDGVRN